MLSGWGLCCKKHFFSVSPFEILYLPNVDVLGKRTWLSISKVHRLEDVCYTKGV